MLPVSALLLQELEGECWSTPRPSWCCTKLKWNDSCRLPERKAVKYSPLKDITIVTPMDDGASL